MADLKRSSSTPTARWARYRILDTPTGPFAVLDDGHGGVGTAWVSGRDDAMLRGAEENATMHEHIVERLHQYFAGEAVDFSDVPTPEPRGRHFFARCWDACRTIPAGETVSYGDLAERAGGARSAARAAGGSMRNNPLPIIVPCHRVIASSGRLHGFSGTTDAESAEVRRKKWLLEMEQSRATQR